MIIGKIHPGSGLGDQLFSYIITRVIALDKGYEFGFVGKEFFKGKEFMDLDWGSKDLEADYSIEQSSGKLILNDWSLRGIKRVYPKDNIFEFNKPYYDPSVNFIDKVTIIDGYGAQDIRYFEHRLPEIKEWLKTDKEYDFYDSDKKQTCIINFRGGEYKMVPDLFLSKSYWEAGINLMKSKFKKMEFEVHTDDRETAEQMFPEIQQPTGWTKIITGIDINWKSLRYAKHAIISNSAFAIIPRLLKHLEDPESVTIAPFGWNARNASLTEWKGRPQNYYSKFIYI